MFFKRKTKELVTKDVFLETYRVRVYLKDREAPLEGIFKQEIVPDYYQSYGVERIHTPLIIDGAYAILSGFKDNIKHYIPSKEIQYVESEMIYRTPAELKVLKEKI